MKNYKQLPIWVLLILLETLAQTSVKFTANALHGMDFGAAWFAGLISAPAAWAAIICYIGSFVVWMIILKKSELSIAFLISSLCYITVILASRLVFKENITLLQCAGMFFIVSGIILLSRAEKES